MVGIFSLWVANTPTQHVLESHHSAPIVCPSGLEVHVIDGMAFQTPLTTIAHRAHAAVRLGLCPVIASKSVRFLKINYNSVSI